MKGVGRLHEEEAIERISLRGPVGLDRHGWQGTGRWKGRKTRVVNRVTTGKCRAKSENTAYSCLARTETAELGDCRFGRQIWKTSLIARLLNA